jgi:hypothetical protein
VWLHVAPDPNMPADQFRMISLRRNRDVTQEYRS